MLDLTSEGIPKGLDDMEPGPVLAGFVSAIDVTTPWSEGGLTEPDGVAPVCRRDHVIRHEAGWTDVHLPEGRYLWTSPLGHTCLTGADPP